MCKTLRMGKGRSSLGIAIATGQEEIVKLLLEDTRTNINANVIDLILFDQSLLLTVVGIL